MIFLKFTHIYTASAVRSPIDLLLASDCIAHGHELFHRHEDFDAVQTLTSSTGWPHPACAAV